MGGDAFGYHMLDEDHFAIYLTDVSGHGVGAALLSVSVMNVLRSQSLPNTDFKDPEQVLEALNIAFPGEENNDMFFTIWYGVYHLPTRTLTYASAGHPPAILFTKESTVISLKHETLLLVGCLTLPTSKGFRVLIWMHHYMFFLMEFMKLKRKMALCGISVNIFHCFQS